VRSLSRMTHIRTPRTLTIPALIAALAAAIASGCLVWLSPQHVQNAGSRNATTQTAPTGAVAPAAQPPALSN
jgi:hypothetical protein